MPTDDTMNLEELARQAGYDVDPEGIAMPIYHADGSADERAQLTRFSALVLEEAAKTAEERPLQSGMDEWDSTAAAIRAMKPVAVPTTSQWMPIETAPKDGKTEVWVYCPDAAYTKCDVARWDGDGRGGYGWVSARCVDGLAVDGTPTLWQPLPALPVAT